MFQISLAQTKYGSNQVLVFRNSENNSRHHKVTKQGEGGTAKHSHVASGRYPRLKVCVYDIAEMS